MSQKNTAIMIGLGVGVAALLAAGGALASGRREETGPTAPPETAPPETLPAPSPGGGGGSAGIPQPGPAPGPATPGPVTPPIQVTTADQLPVDPGADVLRRLMAGEPIVASIEPTSAAGLSSWPLPPKPGLGKPADMITYVRADLAPTLVTGRVRSQFGAHTYVRYWPAGGDMPPAIVPGVIPGVEINPGGLGY